MSKTPMSKYLQNCPKIIFAFDTFLYNPFLGVFCGVFGGCTKTVVKSNPLFDPQGASRFWWAQKQNCPKLFKDYFYFWPKISKIKKKTKKWPLRVKKHFLTHKESPCGSTSGLDFLDWCDGAGAREEGGGKRIRNCLMSNFLVWFFYVSASSV